MIRLLVYTNKTYELDTYGDENIAITYAIDDITDIQKKVGNYSKTFDLPSTKNNNKFFKHLYDLQNDVSQFSTLTGHKCELINNGITVFEGLLYLNEIVKVKTETKYKVNLVGETINFIETLGDATLSYLSFSDLNHEFNNTNITNSATSTGVSLLAGGTSTDIYYSLIQNTGLVGDSNGNFNCFGNRNIQPFVKLLHVIEKIFDYSGFTVESDFLNENNLTFSNIFMDTGLNDGRIRTGVSSMYRRTSTSSSDTVSNVNVPNLHQNQTPILGGSPLGTSENIPHAFDCTIVGGGYLTQPFAFDNIHTITDSYTAIPFSSEPATNPMSGNANDTANMMAANGVITAVSDNLDISTELMLSLWGVAGTIVTVNIKHTLAAGGSTDTELTVTIPSSANMVFGYNNGGTQGLVWKQAVFTHDLTINTGDTISFEIKHDQSSSTTSAYISQYHHHFQGQFINTNTDTAHGTNPFYYTTNPPFGLSVALRDYLLNNRGLYNDDRYCITNFMSLTHEVTNQNANWVNAVNTNGVSDIITTRIHDNHGNVKLADIIKDVFKMFNLVVEQRGQVLKIEPFNDFMQTGSVKDWTSKIDTTEIVQNYENLPSKITWKYKNDEDDAKLNQYKNQTGEDYGSMTIQLPVDYIEEKEIKLDVFSAMALSRLSSGATYPTCYGFENGVYEQIENSPRLIYKNQNTIQATVDDLIDVVDRSSYQSGTHFEDYPTNMTNTSLDLNFGYTANIFSSAIFNQTNNNLFGKYWFDYVIDRYTNERVLVKARAYLTEVDLQNFSFADTIAFENQNYKVVKIEYNAGEKGWAKIEMLKV